MGVNKSVKKKQYFEKLHYLVETYTKVFVVVLDHVGSKQMAEIRHALRNKAVLLMGKNTMIRTALGQRLRDIPQLEKLIECVKENIGFVFCISDPSEVRDIIAQNKVPAPAKQGVIAPIDVTIPAGPTGMDPSQTSFFQALGIGTKIAKAQIEIQNDVHLIKKGDKVSASQSVLLQKLNIRPFAYGLQVKSVYDDGSVYDANVLDITDDDVREMFMNGVRSLAAFSLEVGIPTQASMAHSIMHAFKLCTALVIDTDYSFPQMEPIKNYLADPGAFVSAAPAAAAGGGAGQAASVVIETKIAEPEEEEDEDMGFSLFD